VSTERVIWRNVHIATCDAQGRCIERGALVTLGERIEWVGPEAELSLQGVTQHDLQGRWLTPGLIDCHTHLVFASHRAGEWRELQAGATYAEIAQRGGGILSTVRATRAATEAALFAAAAARLECLLAEGVTALEIKSGYGLTLSDERKMLRVARALARHYPVSVRTTFLAAHAVPPEFAGRADDYVAALADAWLPALHAEGLVDAVDVFCEHIAFDVRQAERLLARAQQLGLAIRMHAEQLSNIGATQLAARFGAASCDHLEYTTAADVAAMARAGTVAVLLPIAFFHLQMTQLPPIAALRQAQVPIAVASDCNPGSAPSPSLQLAMGMAARVFGLTPEEVLLAVTRNAAQALGEAHRGMLAAGNMADFAVWDVSAPEEISYWLGRNLCRLVVRGGVVTQGSSVL
jgi:imidazolonepropionase